MKFSVVVPVYNSASSLNELVVRVTKALKDYGDFELILVNDSSPDQSLEVARELVKKFHNLKVISLSRNFGQICATVAGLSHAAGKYVVFMDDDLQHRPEDILKLYEFLKKNDLDFVYGYDQTDRAQGFLKTLLSKIHWKLFFYVFGVRTSIKPTSFCIITKDLKNNILRYTGPYPFIAGLILRSSLRGDSIPLQFDQRKYGRSNYSFYKSVKLWLDGVTNFSVFPLRLILFVGLLFAFFGFLLVFSLIIIAFTKSEFQSGWLSVVSLIIIFSGVQLICVGIIGEYIGRMFMISNESPQFLVREIIESKNEEKL